MAKKKSRAKKPKNAMQVSEEGRRHMVAETAYFKALARGFNGGDQVRDWLDAEAEVDRRQASGT